MTCTVLSMTQQIHCLGPLSWRHTRRHKHRDKDRDVTTNVTKLCTCSAPSDKRLYFVLPKQPHSSITKQIQTRGRYHGGRRPSSDDSLHSPTVVPPSALDKPSIMKRYHRRRTCSHTSPRLSPKVVTLHDTRFVERRWWNDGWTVKTVVT